MASASHTPGPWALDRSRIYGENMLVASVAYFRDTSLEEANARLIAAAPDMLEALRLLADNIEAAFPGLKRMGPLVQARAAIAKAEGRS